MSDLLPGIRRPARKGAIWAPWIICAAIVLAIGAGVVWLIVSSGEDEYNPNNSYEAIVQCEGEVKERLKAPSTAEFESTATGGGPWTVTGTVDAENSFGAMIRSSYQCTVTIDTENRSANVRIDSLE